MKTLVQTLKLSGNPFEHYTAETEPNIAEYAIRPPYLEAISERVRGLNSFILFGDRGAGKSATRITVYGEMWKRLSTEARSPFVLNLTDYSTLQEAFKKDRLTERDIICAVAFYVVEHVLVWLSSLEEEDRNIYVDGLDKDERALIFAIVKGFYLSVSEVDRNISTAETLRLLNSAWATKSALWASRRWEAFKMSDQGARVRIKNWGDAGLVRQSGTAPSETGAKQAYVFVVANARVKRVIEQKLLDEVGAELGEIDAPESAEPDEQ